MILITGATGFVGRNLIKRLSNTSKVRCLIRKDINLGENVHSIKGDLLNIKSLEEATKDIDTVIHSAAIIKSNKKEEFKKVNVKGTKNLVNACVKNGVKRFIHISSCDVILRNKHDYAYSKLEAEKFVKNSGLDYFIIRPTVIYGKDDKENLGILFNIIKKYPFAPVMGKGNYQLQPVYIEDVINIIFKCLNSKKINKTYFVAGPKALTFNEIIDEASKVLSKKIIKIHFPLPLLRILLKPYEMLAKNPSLTYKKLLSVTENKICDISKTKKDLDFKPLKFEEGLKKVLS